MAVTDALHHGTAVVAVVAAIIAGVEAAAETDLTAVVEGAVDGETSARSDTAIAAVQVLHRDTIPTVEYVEQCSRVCRKFAKNGS